MKSIEPCLRRSGPSLKYGPSASKPTDTSGLSPTLTRAAVHNNRSLADSSRSRSTSRSSRHSCCNRLQMRISRSLRNTAHNSHCLRPNRRMVQDAVPARKSLREVHWPVALLARRRQVEGVSLGSCWSCRKSTALFRSYLPLRAGRASRSYRRFSLSWPDDDRE
jgi:hypothetical protein